jgi:hypothetical protein
MNGLYGCVDMQTLLRKPVHHGRSSELLRLWEFIFANTRDVAAADNEIHQNTDFYLVGLYPDELFNAEFEETEIDSYFWFKANTFEVFMYFVEEEFQEECDFAITKAVFQFERARGVTCCLIDISMSSKEQGGLRSDAGRSQGSQVNDRVYIAC